MPDPAADDKDAKAEEPGPKFWTTTRTILAGIAGLLTAAATLVGALNAAGLIGSHDDEPTRSPTATDAPLRQAVIDGTYDVTVRVRHVEGADLLDDKVLWVFAMPSVGDTDDETWTLDSSCDVGPCSVTWGTASDGLSNKFETLDWDNASETYQGTITARASCGSGSVAVARRLELEATGGTTIAGVWTANRLTGTIRISWDCGGTIKAVLLADATLDRS